MNLPPPFPAGEADFISELRSLPERRVRWDFTRQSAPGELDLRSGIKLVFSFPDPEKVLESVCMDFHNFLATNAIPANGAPLLVCFNAALQGENFRLSVNSEHIRIESGFTEGIRRGIYYLISMLRSQDHPALKFQEFERKYWLQDRISRCFFSPIKRPPFFQDELMDAIDYYPENYLSRLAESGINGLWLTLALKELDQSPDGQRRFAKLRANIAACKRYGIKIWTFCIEPAAWSEDNPLPDELSELVGPKLYNRWQSFCPNSDTAHELLYQSTNNLFKNAPGLGGLITISHGERVTSCLSCVSLYSDGTVPCSRHCGKTPAEIISKVLNPMYSGMRAASPEARMISWLYMPHPDQTGEWIYQLADGIPDDVIMMINFESGCRARQLGKLRNGGDYWLSCVGPSERFGRFAERRKHRKMGAKIQVGCSHECATVPFVPVPGQLYRKYRAMKQLGVEHVMQCWFFGNYPGVMNNAAGLLATDLVELEEREFLKALAYPDWGEYADKLTEIWSLFAAAYEYYPLDIQFQYYGPMHDGPVWPLHTEMSGLHLPRSWKPDSEAAGDAIGECLCGHTLDECIALTGRMSELWHSGVSILDSIIPNLKNDKERLNDYSLTKALDILFNSGYNILRFYSLRARFFDTRDNALEEQMRKIMFDEISNSEELAELCRQDTRLGYHSEAEVYKYHPAKLEWRATELRKSLSDKFKEMQNPDIHRPGIEYKSKYLSWKLKYNGETLSFLVKCNNISRKNEVLRFFFADKYLIQSPWSDLVVQRDGRIPDDNIERQTVSHPLPGAIRDIRQIAVAHTEIRDENWEVILNIPHAALDHAAEFCFGIQHDCLGLWAPASPDKVMDSYPPGEYKQEHRLCFGYYAPEKLIRLKLN